MNRVVEKKFLIVAPIIGGGPWYWQKTGQGNTDNILMAHRFGEKQAKEICDRDKLLKMIPAV